jgi:hypothetical protein
VSPVRYELGFISQKTIFFILTAVSTSNPTRQYGSTINRLLSFRREGGGYSLFTVRINSRHINGEREEHAECPGLQ